MSKYLPEEAARYILQTAINEGKSADLLECLFAGGTVTVDAKTEKLVLIDESQHVKLLMNTADYNHTEDSIDSVILND